MTGIAWYKREQWALLKSIAPDADELEDTFDEWLKHADRSFKDIQETGIDLVKVDVDVVELIAWCTAEGRSADGAARTSFVTHKMKQENRGRGPQPPESDS